MKKTAVIGASGYIGSCLLRTFRKFFPDCVGTSYSRSRADLIPFDLRKPYLNTVELEKTGHQAVLIASGNSNVAWCESHQKESHELNVQGTLKLVEQLGKSSLMTIFLSSDYVFDGQTGGYSDKAKTAPICEYGRQKAEVEREIPKLTQNYQILRLSKIYGTQWKDGTLLDSLAGSLTQGQTIEAATDKIFCPTYLEDLVAMIHSIQTCGLFNLCSPHAFSRYQIGQKLAEALVVSPNLLRPVLLEKNPTLKHIPLNTSLECSSIFRLSSHLTLDEAVRRVASNWKGKR